MKALHIALGSQNKGNTLVELIVVIAIIGLMTSAIVIKVVGQDSKIEASQPTLATENSAAIASDVNDLAQDVPEELLPQVEAMADKLEFQIVQTALDTMMLRQQMTSVNETGETSDMSVFPRENPLYPRYFRNQTTRRRYSCDSTGQISQIK
jgi:prepilin-type N-terminal cleavage/methylation domain-containing protein